MAEQSDHQSTLNVEVIVGTYEKYLIGYKVTFVDVSCRHLSPTGKEVTITQIAIHAACETLCHFLWFPLQQG